MTLDLSQVGAINKPSQRVIEAARKRLDQQRQKELSPDAAPTNLQLRA